jgi:hypothetical protein
MNRDIAVSNKLPLRWMVHYATLNLCEPEPGGNNMRPLGGLELLVSAANNGIDYYLGAPIQALAEARASCRDMQVDRAAGRPDPAGADLSREAAAIGASEIDGQSQSYKISSFSQKLQGDKI